MQEIDIKQTFRAAQVCDIEYFRTCFQQPNLKQQIQRFRHHKSGDTVAHIAVRYGQTELLFYLKCEGFNLEITNFDGKCLLHEAAQNCQHSCLEFLLECRINIDALKRADWTPLMLACTKADVQVIETLLEHGANPQLRNKDGWNSFHIATREGHIAVIVCLLQHDNTLWDTVSRNGRTPLHTAVLHGCTEVVRHLLATCNYRPDMADSCGTTPLMDAFRVQNIASAELLIQQHKTDVYREDNLDRQSLHLSAQAGCLDSIQYLVLTCGVDPAFVSSRTGITALHLAAKEGHSEAVSLLLSLGVDANVRDLKQRTALHIAAGAQHAACVEVLLKQGARQLADSTGTKPDQLARREDVVKLFTSVDNT